MKLQVTPGYGWGWFLKDGDLLDVPPPFDLEVTILEAGSPFKVALGQASGVHPLSGLWIVLAQRHLPLDGECNLYAFRDKPAVPKIPEPFPQEPELTGFASVKNSN